ncbi:MAG: hypothetical protein HYV23_01780 [Deltaproteobacteria bacterium]|nr:hypothetical protein [Deltaproteobacteria bacterium]
MTERRKNLLIWTLLIIVSAVSAWFIVAGKMQYMEREFADYGAAKAAGEFEKGWLPGFLPSSATAIKAINNTDNKSALVSFSYTGDIDMSACKELPLIEATLPAERVVLWWPEELTQKGTAQAGYAFFKCGDGQAAVNAGKKEVYFWK